MVLQKGRAAGAQNRGLEERAHIPVEVASQVRVLVTGEVVALNQVDAQSLQPWQNLVPEDRAEPLLLEMNHAVDSTHELGRLDGKLPNLLLLEQHQAAQSRHPDSEELIQVGREDREKLEALE